MRFILGVTGGIGSGKTAATDRFATYGITVVDADKIARQVVEPPSPALTDIADHFGADILLADGGLNRAKLRHHIFQSPRDKQWLEQLLHPLIRQQLLTELQAATSPYVILSAPLLFENNLDKIVDRSLVIDCEEKLQLERTTLRDQTDIDTIQQIINQQIDRSNRLQRADDIITNNGTLTELHQAIDRYHHQLMQQLSHENTA